MPGGKPRRAGRAKRTKSGKYAYQKHVYKVFGTRRDLQNYRRQHEAALARLDHHASLEPSCCGIRDRLEKFLRDRTEGIGCAPCGEKTAALYRRTLLRFDAAFHSKPLAAVTRSELEAWRRRRRQAVNGKRVMRDTVNRDIDMLKTFARWAQGQGWAPADLPLLTLPRLWEPGKLAGLNRKPPRYMGTEQLFGAIGRIGSVRRDIGLFFEGMLFFVLRPAALGRLRRRDVSLPVRGRPGRLWLERIKGMHGRYVTIDPGSLAERWARECLAMGAGLGPDGPLLICMGGRSRINPGGWTTATLDRAVARACGAVGLKFTPYMIRHSAIAWAHRDPRMSAANVQVAAGHARITTQTFSSHVLLKNAPSE